MKEHEVFVETRERFSNYDYDNELYFKNSISKISLSWKRT